MPRTTPQTIGRALSRAQMREVAGGTQLARNSMRPATGLRSRDALRLLRSAPPNWRDPGVPGEEIWPPR